MTSGIWFGGLHILNHRRRWMLQRLMIAFPATAYQARPTYEQLEQFISRAEEEGYSPEGMAALFALGFIPPALDALMQELAATWQPIGEPKEGKHEQA